MVQFPVFETLFHLFGYIVKINRQHTDYSKVFDYKEDLALFCFIFYDNF